MFINPDLFGKPGTGIHSYRIFGMAAFDWLFTIIAIFISAYIYNIYFDTKTDFKIILFYSTIFWVLLAIIAHYIVGVHTALNNMLGL